MFQTSKILTNHKKMYTNLSCVLSLFHEVTDGDEMIDDVDEQSEYTHDDSHHEDVPQHDHDVMVQDVLRVLTDELVPVIDLMAFVSRSFLNLRYVFSGVEYR